MGILDDPQTGGRLLLGAADYLTVLLLTVGSALAFLTGYGVEASRGAVLYFCVFAALFSTVLHSLKNIWWSAAATGMIALIFWLTWDAVAPVLHWLGQKMGAVPVLTGLPLSALTPDRETLLPVLLLLCAVLAWIMGWIAVRARRWYLAALLSFTLILPAIQMGVLPMWGAMLAAFTGWGSMLLTALYGRKDPGGLGRAQLLSLSGIAALALVLALALPMDGYERPQWATDARTGLIQGVTRRLERFFDLDKFDSSVLTSLGLDLSLPSEESGNDSSNDGASVSASESFGGGQSQRENLGRLGPRRYQRRQIMEVRTDEPAPAGRTYLLGGTLNVYTGDSWENTAVTVPGVSPMMAAMFPAVTARGADLSVLGADACTMTIRYSGLGGTWYYPYRFTGGAEADESGRILEISRQFTEGAYDDLDLLPNRSRQYQMPYLPGGPEDGFIPLTDEWAKAEELYRSDPSFAAVYLDVPDAVRQVLGPLLSREAGELILSSLEEEAAAVDINTRGEVEERIGQMQQSLESRPTLEDLGGAAALTADMSFQERYEAVITAAARTAELLSQWAVYDLDTPAMGEGEDFIAHFLGEGRGYCVHFATAGTMLLRMQGIPARYAAGYIADLNDQGYARVLDSDAHAWVEVYLDGYGWFPVEMTPGYAGGESGAELSNSPAVEISNETSAPEEDQEEEIPDAAGAEEEPEDLPGEALEETGRSIVIPWRTIGRVALVLAALGSLYGLALLMRRRARTAPDTNRSVIDAYRRYSRVLRLGGVADDKLEELGRKARFSQHTLTEEERSAAWESLDQTVKAAMRRLKKRKRALLSLLRPWL